MRTRIIAAFPGMGKSTYHKKFSRSTLDSDSSKFSWVIKGGLKIRNPIFPNNYINYIKKNIGKYKFIFVSTHDIVRDALIKNCLFFYLIYPIHSRKKEFLKNYEKRNNDRRFIDRLNMEWDGWITDCCRSNIGCENIPSINHYLDKELKKIMYNEGDIKC